MKRKIHTIIFHCSASDEEQHDDVSVMRRWHKMRGWSDVGYHFFVKKDGTIQYGRPLNRAGAHVKGNNRGTIGVCFHGLNSFTKQQMDSAWEVLDRIRGWVGVTLPVKSHNEYTTMKTCPNFKLEEFLQGKVIIIKEY